MENGWRFAKKFFSRRIGDENFDIIAYARSQIEKSNDCDAVERVLSALGDKNSGDIVCVACSGGSDSVFLVKYVLERFPNLRPRMVILHFNHALRGENSDGDGEFVRIFAENNGVNFHWEKLENRPSTISEGTLRVCRNEFFARAMGAFNSKVLLLGHQKNDVAETLLMRLIRASGTDGLAAPRALTIFKDSHVKLRPLLNFTKEEIENRLRAANIEWRTDESNFENDFFRNKIRNIVLPQLRRAAKGVDVFSNLAVAKKNIEEADDAVSFFAAKYLAGKNLGGSLEISTIRDLPSAVAKKIFAQFLLANGIEVRKSYVDTLLKKMHSAEAGAFGVGKRSSMEFDGESFRIVRRGGELNWAVENLQIGENLLPNGRTLRMEIVKITKDLLDTLGSINVGTRCYAAFDEGTGVAAKNYRPNYKYVRFGHVSPRKLGDIVGEKIVPLVERRSLPVIFIGGEACWVPGLPVSNLFKIKGSGGKALLLTYL